MDIRYSPEAECYRQKVRAFLDGALPEGWAGLGALETPHAEQFIDAWRALLHRNGLIAVGWPKEYGGGRDLSFEHQVVLAEEFARADAPRGNSTDSFGINLCGNTILRWGTDAQRLHFLPRIANGEYRFCQGYSEPDSGSDLASLRTTAVRDGDVWRINGQKIWTTAVLDANWLFLLARSGPTSEGHRGLSFVLCPLDQSGIEVRPIRMMSGPAEFGEVFLTDAVAQHAHLIGGEGEGWKVANTLLGYERSFAAASQAMQYRMELDRLVGEAQRLGRTSNPSIRQMLTRCHIAVEIMRFTGYQALSTMMSGSEPGPEASLSKLAVSTYHRSLGETALSVLGTQALAPTGRPALEVIGPDVAGGESLIQSWVDVFMNSRAGTIYGGTSEVQRSIIGERILGLPREPKT